jgi:hypothetical protein
MPDRQDDLNPASDLAPFADALQKLAPQPPHLSRDALLFMAGKAAGSSRLPPWTWPSVAAGFAAISLVLAGFLAAPSSPGGVQYVDRDVYVQVPAEPPHPMHHFPPTEESPRVEPKSKASPEPTETAKLLKQHRDVLRWGVEMLPESKSSGSGQSQEVVASDLKRWLNLPPGTFAAPIHEPRKPTKDEDDE